MALPGPIDYTSRDYNSFKTDMISLIATRVPEWTNISESDFGVILIELFCHIADSLAYYQDKEANEAFLPTATQRRSIIKLARLIGYELSAATAAQVDLDFVVTEDPDNDQTILAGTKVSSTGSDVEQPVIFETDIDLVISAGDTTGTVAATEGESQDEIIGVSTQIPGQTFQLPFFPLISGSLQILVDEGSGYILWTLVTNIAESGATDKVYYIQTDENDQTTVFFGDGINGKIPTNGAVIKAQGRTGGGVRGNVGTGKINVLISAPSFVVSVNNPGAASGGTDKEDIEHARVFAPASLKALNRAVTLEDFTTLAGAFAGVLQAGALVVTAGNISTVTIYIQPTGGGSPSSGLKTSVKDFLDLHREATVIVAVDGPTYVTVKINVTVNVLPNFKQTAVQAAVQAVIDAYFVAGAKAFGQEIFLGDTYAIFEAVDGVRNVNITKHTMDALLTPVLVTGTPVFGAITVLDGIVDDIWTVELTDATHFTVTGTNSGLQVATGTFGVLYTIDSGKMSFTITAGGGGSLAGDHWLIRTSEWIGDIEMDDNEIAVDGGATLAMVGGL